MAAYKRGEAMENNILLQIKELDKLIVWNFSKLIDQDTLRKLMPHPSITQIRIITYILNAKKDVYQRDLEKVLNLSRATISGVMQTMEKNNLIKRVAVNTDGRIKKIVLNKQTKELFLKHQKNLQNIEENLIKDISLEELTLFKDTLTKMILNLKEELHV